MGALWATLLAAPVVVAPISAQAATPLPPQQRTNGPIATAGLFVVNADGTDPGSPLTRLAGSDPAWSPTSLRLAYTSIAGARPQVDIVDADGTDRQQLTHDPAGASDPTWSADGGSIAFTSTRDGNREIYVIGVDGQGERRLTNDPGIDQQADWSTGDTIVFESNRAGNFDLWLMDPGGGSLRQLTSAPANDWDADWSPDATRIAYASVVPGGQAIFSIAPDGSGDQRLTTGGGFAQFPVWSPDGALIAFTTKRSPSGIWLMPAGGDAGGPAAHPAISDANDADWAPLPPPATPVILGRSAANIAPTAGQVTVTPPSATAAAAPLQGDARVAVGSVVQTTDGTATVQANPAGATPPPADQLASVSGGAFVLDPPAPDGATLRLLGPRRPARCMRAAAQAARVADWPRLRVRSRGRFRTITKDTAASSMGTSWLTIESCRGTLTRVGEGVVDVRSLRTGRVVRVTAGHEYLAPRIFR